MTRLTTFMTILLLLLLTACSGMTLPQSPNQPPTTTPPILPDDPPPPALTPIIPDTTKVADEATRAALTSFDLQTGILRFSSNTPTLSKLEQGDVLVSEPSSLAPYGYLRKVAEVRQSGSGFVLNTVQATLTEAVTQGSFFGQGELKSTDLTTTKVYFPGVKVRALPQTTLGLAPAADAVISEGYNYEVKVDQVINFDAADGDVGAKGEVRVQGAIRFSAGYRAGASISPCFALPPVCLTRAEASAGIQQYAQLKLSSKIEGHVKKEITLASLYYKPIILWIGPIPVVFVPKVNIVMGANGEGRATFTFESQASAQFLIGARYTDDDGWQDLSKQNGFQAEASDPTFEATMNLRGYGKAEAELLLYGVIGPAMDIQLGAGIDIQVPRRPLWKIFGHVSAHVGINFDLLGLKDDIYKKTLFEAEPTLVEASNYPPRFSNVPANPIQVDLNEEVNFSPFTGGIGQGPYRVTDPEGGNLSVSVASDRDGTLPLTYAFPSSGPRTLTVTARDDEGASSAATLIYNVVSTPPELKVSVMSDTVPAGTQYFVSATARDMGSYKPLGCEHFVWTVEAPDTVMSNSTSGTACDAAIVFNIEGQRSLSVTATVPQGASASKTVSVNVSSPPPNLPPTIDSFSIKDNQGVEVPDGGYFHPGSGSGTYFYPIRLIATASDPTGESVSTIWSCIDDGSPVQVVDNGDGSFTCDPSADGGFGTVVVAFEASDGVTPTRQSRTFYPGSVVN